MAKARALQERIKIPGISETGNLARFCDFLGERYLCKRVEDKGEYVVAHSKIRLQKRPRNRCGSLHFRHCSDSRFSQNAERAIR
jgi:hypothetical protein